MRQIYYIYECTYEKGSKYNVPGSLQARASALSRSEEANGNMQISGTSRPRPRYNSILNFK